MQLCSPPLRPHKTLLPPQLLHPGLYFSKALLRGLIFGGAYLQREICVSKSIGLALYLEATLPFLLCFTLYLGQISKYKPPGGSYLEGRFNRGFFVLPVWGAHIWRGLYMEGLIFGILQYCRYSETRSLCWIIQPQ